VVAAPGTRLEIQTADCVFYLVPPGGNPAWNSEWKPAGRLIGVDNSPSLITSDEVLSIVFATGCRLGPVWVTLHALNGPPPASLQTVTEQGWDEGDEETLSITSPLSVSSPSCYSQQENVFVPVRPGLHRVRVLARGRWVAWDAILESPLEEFDISVWPVES
jgi:hypothetical protein